MHRKAGTLVVAIRKRYQNLSSVNRISYTHLTAVLSKTPRKEVPARGVNSGDEVFELPTHNHHVNINENAEVGDTPETRNSEIPLKTCDAALRLFADEVLTETAGENATEFKGVLLIP